MRAVQGMKRIRWAAFLLPVALLASGCGKGKEHTSAGDVGPAWSPSGAAEVKGVPVSSIRDGIQRQLAAGPKPPFIEDQWRHVKQLYASFGQAPLWLQKDGFDRTRVEPLTKALVDAHADGLRLDAYPLADIAQAIKTIDQTKNPTAEQLANAEVLLTGAYAALSEDLLTGQVDPRKISQAWHIDPREDDVDSALTRSLRSGALDKSLAAMRPQDEDYAALRTQLAHYRELAAKGNWPAVPSGKAVKPGERESLARLSALRARLAAEGVNAESPANGQAAAGSGVYDRTLAGAVAQFQARHGIPVDSILGEETVKSLNVPVSYRMAQIAANLERHRWLPRTLGARYILVNVPAFKLQAFDDGKPPLEMKVIVGAEYEDRATPVFSDSMQTVVFRPYWLVTDQIAAKEIFPKIEADPGFMDRNDYELYRSEGKTRVRQRPGPKNSLGLVKFLFPNDFNIYLHDTPEDQLFQKDVRAFSHGCIRLEKPAELAQWVLGWPADKVKQAMESGADNRTVNLPKKIPVYITYFTAYMNDGQLYFGNDLYERDAVLVKAVANGQSSGEAVRAVTNLRKLIGD